MPLINGVKALAKTVFNSWIPTQNPKSLPFTIPFVTSGSPYLLDLVIEETTGELDFIQGIYVDNSLNPEPLTIVSQIIQQSVVIPAQWQGWVSILCPAGAQLTFSSTGGVNVPVQLVNFPVATTLWPVNAFSVPATQVNIFATGANATVTATLPAVAGKTNFLSGFDVSGLGATAAQASTVTLAGLGANMIYEYSVPAGVAVAGPLLSVRFAPALQATGKNVAVSVAAAAFGAGNTQASVLAMGYLQ